MNFCKSHNVSPPSIAIKKEVKKKANKSIVNQSMELWQEVSNILQYGHPSIHDQKYMIRK
jgi:hypothetical protein